MKVWEAREKLLGTLMELDKMSDVDNVYLFGGHIETAEDIINFQYDGLLKEDAKLDEETSELVIKAYGEALMNYDFSEQNDYITDVLRGETKYNDVDIFTCLTADVVDIEQAKEWGWEGDNDEDDNTNDEDED